MRGQRTLFDYLLQESIVVVEEIGGAKQGRNEALIQQRDRRMLYRYYYYVKILRYQYDDTLSELMLEFDLSKFRITDCLKKKEVALKAIFHSKPSVRELQRLYPWLLWTIE